ncbi:MAG: hypothetical protein Q7K45_02865 [Nanoarchaeota archaeon]|nr:hypothetical protein [Nanoarchaeota archaeon]
MSYDIKLCNEKEFTEAMKSDPRYSYVDETNLGFADRLKGKAYVRHTSEPELTKYLIFHELEELEEDHSTHEDKNGIRHKKGGFFKNFLAPVLFGPLAPLVTGQRAAGKAILGNFGNALTGGITGGLTGGPAGAGVGAIMGGLPFGQYGKSKEQQSQQQDQQSSMFHGMDFGIPGSSQNAPNYASPASPFSDQQSSQGGLNQGLNSNSVNPLTDTSNPYARYGQQQGRVINF